MTTCRKVTLMFKKFIFIYQDRTLIGVQTRSPQRLPSFLEVRDDNTTYTHRIRRDRPREDAQDVQCIECIKIVPVYSPTELEIGDHVVFINRIYEHHGIITNKGDGCKFEVAEATNTALGLAGAVSTSKVCVNKANLVRSWKEIDFLRNNIGVVEYRHRKFKKRRTAARARKYCDSNSNKFKYNLFTNNCEHFATFCVMGTCYSLQVKKLEFRILSFLSSTIFRLECELERNEKQFEKKIICNECYKINKTLMSVQTIKINREKDVKQGDIIMYPLHGHWHHAVVLEKKAHRPNKVVCSIAHYTFSVLRRKIEKEDIDIQFRGNFYKLNYTEPEFEVYDPEDVVKRAQSRIGEQNFVFFTNESSHYTRWCKLKPWKSEMGIFNLASLQYHRKE